MGRHNGRRDALGHFQGQRRPRQNRRRRAGHGGPENARHGQAALVFQPLGHADGQAAEGGKAARDFAEKSRWHGDDNTVGALEGFLRIVPQFDLGRKRDSRQEQGVGARLADLRQVGRIVRPKGDGMIVLRQ